MTIPIHDDTAPITCTAGSEELTSRYAQIERMRDAMTTIERTRFGLLLHFAPTAGTEAELRRFAVEEQGCCRFWGFEVQRGQDDLTLRWDGPPSVDELLDRLYAWFQSGEPMTAGSGLL